MPYVGKKKFAYTDKGKQDAFEYAQKVKQPVMEVNQFGNKAPTMSLDKNRFGRRDKSNKKKTY